MTAHTWEAAAVLACGSDAFLSHQSAGRLFEALPYLPRQRLPHVTVVGRNPGRRRAIVLHRTASVHRSEVTREYGIPVTSLARTILDLACVIDTGDLEQAIAEGFARNRLSRSKLIAQLELQPGHRGAARVRAQLGGTTARTRSRAERRLLTAIRRAALPAPDVNARVGRWEVDYSGAGIAWPSRSTVTPRTLLLQHSNAIAGRPPSSRTRAIESCASVPTRSATRSTS